MNITDTIHIIRSLPETLWETAGFLRWNLERLMDDSGEDEDDDEASGPLSPHEAGRLALEVTMILSATQGDPEAFHRLINEVVPAVDSPQRAMDVIMSLAGMVNALADEEDLERFGKIILRHEARQG